MRFWLVFFCISLASFPASASELEFALSDDTFETSYQSFYAGNFSSTASWLHADIDDIRSDTLGLGLFANGKNANIRTHLGGKAFWLDTEDGLNQDISMHGIALGGAVDIYLMPTLLPRLYMTLKVFYSPDVLTGGDYENFTELGARLSYRILSNAVIFAGYRFNEVEIDDTDIEFEVYKGGFAGFNFNI